MVKNEHINGLGGIRFMRYVLSVEGLSKKYPNFSLNNVSLNIEKGKIMGFIGQNGAGKSTTINSIVGITPFDKGVVRINELDICSEEAKVKQVVGYVGENVNLYSNSLAVENYRFIKRFYTNWDDAYFKKLIKYFNVDLSKKIKDLSKGTKIKFYLALALAHHPEILVMDEPTSGLDPVIRDEILDIFYDLAKREGTTILFSSHITEDIVKIADDITYIYNGTILLTDTKKNILENYKRVEFLNKIPNFAEHINLKRKNSIIVDDFEKFTKRYSIKNNKNQIKVHSTSLDEVLLFAMEGGR